MLCNSIPDKLEHDNFCRGCAPVATCVQLGSLCSITVPVSCTLWDDNVVDATCSPTVSEQRGSYMVPRGANRQPTAPHSSSNLLRNRIFSVCSGLEHSDCVVVAVGLFRNPTSSLLSHIQIGSVLLPRAFHASHQLAKAV